MRVVNFREFGPELLLAGNGARAGGRNLKPVFPGRARAPLARTCERLGAGALVPEFRLRPTERPDWAAPAPAPAPACRGRVLAGAAPAGQGPPPPPAASAPSRTGIRLLRYRDRAAAATRSRQAGPGPRRTRRHQHDARLQQSSNRARELKKTSTGRQSHSAARPCRGVRAKSALSLQRNMYTCQCRIITTV
jgi:hypothetical protein